MFLRVIEYAFIALVIIIMIMQVIVPLARGTLLFPFFRRERQLEQELQRLKQEAIEADLERKIAVERKNAEEGRKPGGASGS
jgi:hypothetical protein